MQNLVKIVCRASQLYNLMWLKFLEFLEEIIQLEASIEVSELSEEAKSKLKRVLREIKMSILEDYGEVNAFNRV